MLRVYPDTTMLAVTRNGFGKRTELDEYKTQTRGGKGILTYRVTEKTGAIIGALGVSEDDDLMLISGDGTIIRMHVDEISVLSRVTQGVTLMRTAEENRVVSMTRLSAALANEEPEEQEEELLGTADEEPIVEDESGAAIEAELSQEPDPEETEE